MICRRFSVGSRTHFLTVASRTQFGFPPIHELQPGSAHTPSRLGSTRPPLGACTCCGHPACWQVVRRDSFYWPRSYLGSHGLRSASATLGTRHPRSLHQRHRMVPSVQSTGPPHGRTSSQRLMGRALACPRAGEMGVERSVVHVWTECPLRYFRNAE